MSNFAKLMICEVIKQRFQLGDVKLKGTDGYFWFSGNDTANFKDSVVRVPKLNSLDVEGWVGEFKRMFDKYNSPVERWADWLVRQTEEFVCDWTEPGMPHEESVDCVKDMLFDWANPSVPLSIRFQVVDRTIELFGNLSREGE